MERRLAASPEDPFLCGACREKREELWALEDHRARGAFVRSRIRLLREMDRGSRFFYALEKMREAKKHVTCLLTEDGTPLTDPVEMCGRARDFYTSLFSLDPTDPGTCSVPWEELPTVSVGDRDRLELPLTLAEFSEALHRMPTNKSPGMDGLIVEFYRTFWDILGPDLATVWAESLQGCSLCCRRRGTSAIYETGVPSRSLARTTKSRLTGLVLWELELRLVLSAYAEDVLLVVQDPGDLARVEACQAIYSAASSTRVNWVKSSGLAVGDWRHVSSLPPALQTIRWSADPLLYLGVYLSAMHPSPLENWQNLEG
ncbi:unnamed protein product [Caretta caretta]